MDPIAFLHDTTPDELTAATRHQTMRCLVDVCGSVVAGSNTPMSHIVRDYACDVHGGNHASVFLDGRRVSAPGAALANGMTIDSFDIHDSHRESLGHAGAHVFPATIAAYELRAARGGALPSGEQLLTTLTVGYDLACRAGEALHATVDDYHTSGAWGAVSSAAIYARVMGLDREMTRHALGIGEYHGPRSQMMRCIDHPTMLKDGSGWGAMAGISAGMLAERGFTGAPAVTVESPEVRERWSTLGSYWYVAEQGFKAHGSCWWSHPPIEAALELVRTHQLGTDDIATITIDTFEKGTHLDHVDPRTTEQAQYSIPFPVAAALVKATTRDDGWYGVGPRELLEDSLADPETRRLAAATQLREAPALTATFPTEMAARVTLLLTDGRTLTSPETTFRGELHDPLSDTELNQKFRWLASSLLPRERVDHVEQLAWAIDEQASIGPLLDALTAEVER